MENPVQAEPKKSNTGLIIGIIIAVVLVCCCFIALIVFVIPLLFGPTIGNTFSSINESLMLTPNP